MLLLLLRLLLLLLLALTAECQTVGKDFVAVFPENIAYYHPSPAQNRLRVTALHENTNVTISLNNNKSYNPASPQQSGEIREFGFGLELDKSNDSAKVLYIKSDQSIAVELVSQKNNSIQTAVLLPTDLLGKEYQVPPVPYIQRTTQPEADVTSAVTERSRFKLILVNALKDNTISVPNSQSTSVSLKPKEVAQVWVEYSMATRVVSGTGPFLALFGHTCAVEIDCTCGLLYTPLQPKTPNISTFIVPSVFSQGAQTVLLKTSSGERTNLSSGSEIRFEDTGPVLLQSPGMLLNLIPKEEFGSCFSFYTVENTKNWVIIMAPSNSTADVQINLNPVTSVSWTPVSGTNFSSARMDLTSGKHIIWHKSALMTAWFIGEKVTKARFGNPAAQLSRTPDYRGCVVIPEQLEVLEERLSWQESIKACRDKNLELISLKDQLLQDHVYDLLQNHKDNLTELWMGLRRSSYSGRWYWISEDPLVQVDWAPGSPGLDDQDQDHGPCAQINLTDSQGPRDLSWTHQDCCTKARPVCYRPPKLLQISPTG